LTLNGGRAVRNEFILLHEFHRLKYVCPDKVFSSFKKKDDAEDGEDAPPAKTRGKAKYAGGLVFEPKRGLWDTYILVMDFNSLYPSIIQEYNIDFTTVDRTEDEDVSEVIPD
jgi:DNA polymerase alpha subunit A